MCHNFLSLEERTGNNGEKHPVKVYLTELKHTTGMTSGGQPTEPGIIHQVSYP